MKKVIFVKYSNERDDRFKIRTVIEQDENGSRYVRKYAMTEAAREHIVSIVKYADKLSQNEVGTKFCFNRCSKGNGYIDFDYVSGEPLSEVLIHLIAQKNEEKAFELICEYCNQIQQMATEPFVITEEFKQVFGNVEFKRKQRSCKITDVDLIFSNILVDEDKWNVIDLEWTFDFPIPVNFLIFRAILFGGTHIKEFADQFQILEKLGIDSEEQKIFGEMDLHFQQWVKGTEVAHWEMAHLQNRKSIAELNDEAVAREHHIQALNAELAMLKTSRSWKLTAPLRNITTTLRTNRYTYLILKGIKSLKKNGFRVTVAKVKNKLRYARIFKKASNRPLYTEAELRAQRREKFARDIKISVLVPLYNTPEAFLREMIQSVLNQTYANWELCLADGSDAQHERVGQICQEYVQNDPRVCYQKLEKNLGISGNTNACIDMSTGDYIALFDHDDLLHPAALHDVMKEICEKNADFIYTDEATFESPNIKRIITVHHKPDYAIDNLRANNYICHLSVFSREVMNKAGYLRAEYDGSQDHDFILRLTAKAERIVHIPNVLYYWRSHPQSVSQDISAKEYAISAGRSAVRSSIKEAGFESTVMSSRAFPTIYRIKYTLESKPKVSIIIPNKNHVKDLQCCVNSILTKTTYKNFEIVIVDNGSDDPKTLEYYNYLKRNPRITLCQHNIAFNFSELNNFAVKHATGEYYLFLNNDTEVITPEWIEELLMYAQRKDVGAVGAMLYYPDDTVQHAGVILGLGEDHIAGHGFWKYSKYEVGYMGRLCYAQNLSAVTAACMMVKASVFHEVGEYNEEFAVAYNDVDLCMRIRRAGYLIVWTPFAELYHYESKSRGYEDTPEKKKRFRGEVELFRKLWQNELDAGDPYYNPNLTLDGAGFSLK